MPLGDFNLPRAAAGDRIFDALVALGLETPSHSSQMGSAIASDNQYDQDLWAARTKPQFLSYVRYHISDHRPLWLELETG